MSKGFVAGNNWLDRVLLSDLLHVQTLMLTDVQTAFLGTPSVPLAVTSATRQSASRGFGPPGPGPRKALRESGEYSIL